MIITNKLPKIMVDINNNNIDIKKINYFLTSEDYVISLNKKNKNITKFLPNFANIFNYIRRKLEIQNISLYFDKNVKDCKLLSYKTPTVLFDAFTSDISYMIGSEKYIVKDVYIPPILMISESYRIEESPNEFNINCRIYAYMKKRKMFVAWPFGNCYPDGSICFGKNDSYINKNFFIEKNKEGNGYVFNLTTYFNYIKNVFFNSVFNRDLLPFWCDREEVFNDLKSKKENWIIPSKYFFGDKSNMLNFLNTHFPDDKNLKYVTDNWYTDNFVFDMIEKNYKMPIHERFFNNDFFKMLEKTE